MCAWFFGTVLDSPTVAEQQNPHSVLIQRRTEFTICLPPRKGV
jgi:hypothetical protein